MRGSARECESDTKGDTGTRWQHNTFYNCEFAIFFSSFTADEHTISAIVGEQFTNKMRKWLKQKERGTMYWREVYMQQWVTVSWLNYTSVFISRFFLCSLVLSCSLFSVCLWVIKLEFFPRQKSSKEKKGRCCGGRGRRKMIAKQKAHCKQSMNGFDNHRPYFRRLSASCFVFYPQMDARNLFSIFFIHHKTKRTENGREWESGREREGET